MKPSHLIAFILSLTAQFTSANLKCRPEGPVLPQPTALANSSTFQAAAANLTETLNAALTGSITAGWQVKNVSFSLAVVSADQKEPGVPIWEYHHLAAANTKGTKHPDRDSQYLIGSITKVFTDYVLLKSGMDLDAPITEYLSGLDGKSSIRWRDDSEILSGMKESYPQTTPNERPAYSNMAFVILGMALEEHTGKNFSELIEHFVSGPLGMSSTFPSPGNDDKAVIPPGESSWGSDYKLITPAGGLVSSISDLSKFSYALLSRALNMTSAEINGWLKPSAFAGNAYTMTDHPHPVTIYGKSGGAQNYRSQLSFVDDYGLAVIILTAGPMKAAPILTNAMLSTIASAADRVSREQAGKYEQKYVIDTEDGVLIEASLKQDDDSMILASLYRNGTDIITSLTDIWGLTLGDFLPEVGPKIRMFPSKLGESATLDGKPAVKEVWHLWPDLNSGFETDLTGNEIEEMNCVGWSIQDWIHYGGEPLDRVLVYVGEDGDVRGFEVPFLRSGILRPVSQ
ncbi:hypothetical protein IL306_002220 [Fusarium sp. DS 682]|nr:hypothetical protein IL306_002220 [Fusarium sp. DS 682]